MPEKIFRTEPAFFGVLCCTRLHVFHRFSYKNRNSSACQHIIQDKFRNKDHRRTHSRAASTSARFSDILRENYPHLCGNLSHLRISSLYILSHHSKKCNSFLKFFYFCFCRNERNYLDAFCAFCTTYILEASGHDRWESKSLRSMYTDMLREPVFDLPEILTQSVSAHFFTFAFRAMLILCPFRRASRSGL